jgi:Spy/CpxP family protein refolding chaperone
MKKLLVLVAVFTTVLLSNANAQQGNGNFDPAQMAQRYKERVKPQLIEKVKLTDAQAEKVCDIQLASRQQMRGLRDLSEDDRKKKIEEIQADNNKQYKAIPLTDDQIKAVNDFMDEMRKQMQQQRQNGGGGNN